jgi:phage terminase, large subunit, PBSX family
MGYTVKQSQVINTPNKRWNILIGAVSSGKTHATFDLIPVRMLEQPPGPVMLIGKTERTLKRNVLDPMRDRHGSKFVSRVYGDGEIDIYGRHCYIMGANNVQAMSKIQGLTLAYGYGDEVTTWEQTVFGMLKSRLRVPGACFDGTANPDNPNHWFKEFLDDEKIKKNLWHFTIDDNTFLDDEYVENIKAEYSGHWYKRYILGEWCGAEGLIYDVFNPEINIVDTPPIRYTRTFVAVDYGHANATVFLLFGEGTDGYLYLIDEYYHSGTIAQQGKSPRQYAQDLINFCRLHGANPSAIILDPSALGFKLQLEELGVRNVVAANNDVLAGIQTTATVIESGLLRVHRRCKNTIKETQSYSWDNKVTEKTGEDKPIKQNDHCMDALRYGVMNDRHYWIQIAVKLKLGVLYTE